MHNESGLVVSPAFWGFLSHCVSSCLGSPASSDRYSISSPTVSAVRPRESECGVAHHDTDLCTRPLGHGRRRRRHRSCPGGQVHTTSPPPYSRCVSSPNRRRRQGALTRISLCRIWSTPPLERLPDTPIATVSTSRYVRRRHPATQHHLFDTPAGQRSPLTPPYCVGGWGPIYYNGIVIIIFEYGVSHRWASLQTIQTP